MTEVTTEPKTGAGSHLCQWLFNPFKFVAGYKALLSGLVIILLTAFIASFGNIHFDGVLDVHTGLEAPLWCFFAEGLINWICMAVPLFFFGLIVSRSSFRAIDILGTQALARGPYLIAALAMLPDANRRFGEYLTARFTQATPAVAINYADVLVFAFAVFAVIVIILMTVWMVALMYMAYTLSCNIKGAKAVITFIVSLIGAEVLSKAVILQLLR
ncbi:MAG: hypothetical protein ACYS6W_02915 [Planctomycetota bacterium]|jgi:hypothetical protein